MTAAELLRDLASVNAVKAARKKVRALAAAQDAKRLKTEAREIEQGVQQQERDLATALAKGEAPGS